MRTGARFHRRHPCRVDQPGAAKPFGILTRHQVVGDDREVDPACLKDGDQPLDQGRLAGADRTADPNPRRGSSGAELPARRKARRFRKRRSSQHVALRERQLRRWLAGRQLTVDKDVETSADPLGSRGMNRSTSCWTS